MGLYWGYIGVILGLYWDNGKENGNYYVSGTVRFLYCFLQGPAESEHLGQCRSEGMLGSDRRVKLHACCRRGRAQSKSL